MLFVAPIFGQYRLLCTCRKIMIPSTMNVDSYRTSVNMFINYLLNKCEDCMPTYMYLPEVFVETERRRSEVCVKKLCGKYFPVQTEQTRWIRHLLYGFFIIKLTAFSQHWEGITPFPLRPHHQSTCTYNNFTYTVNARFSVQLQISAHSRISAPPPFSPRKTLKKKHAHIVLYYQLSTLANIYW